MPPRAARSHSASVGKRYAFSVARLSHRQYAVASSQDTATTGIRGSLKSASFRCGRGAPPVATRKQPYSAFVTWCVASPNASTHTRCTGFSSSRPLSQPIPNQPSGMRTISGSIASACAPLNLAPLIPDGTAILSSLFLPHAEAAEEGIFIAAQPGAGRQLLQFLAVSPAQDDVIGFQSSTQLLRNFRNLQTPFFLPQSLEAAQAEIVFVRFPFFVREVCQLHRLQDSIHDHRRPEARAKSQKQHAAALITAERLHGSVVQYLHGTAKGFAEVEFHPAAPQVMGLAKRVSVNDRTGISQCHPVELPIPDALFDFADHFARRHGGTGGKFAGLFLPAGQKLDVRAANEDK